METVIRLNASEFNSSLINKIKKFLATDGDSEITISISKTSRKKSLRKETPAQTKARIDRAIDDIENKRNLVSFTGEEFEKFASRLSGK